MTDAGPDSALHAFVRRYDELRTERGTNFTRLAAATGFTRAYCSAAAKGREVPSVELTAELDDALDADGELLALRDLAADERTARRRARHGNDDTKEVRPTDRRQLITTSAAFSFSTVLASAADRSRAIAAATSDPLTLSELEYEYSEIHRLIHSTDPTALLPRVHTAWDQVETLLDGRVAPRTAVRLTVLAGQYASKIGFLGRFMGSEHLARRFAVVAGQHADATADPGLLGTVAALDTWIAMDAGQWSAAADAAARGRHATSPGLTARLAAYEAVAASAAGLTHQADEALAAMHASMSTATTGTTAWNDAEEDLYTALAAVHLPGQATLAITHGTRAARTFIDDNQGVGLAHCAVAQAHLATDNPRPDEAAAAAIAALDAVADSPNADVERRVQTVARKLAPWPTDDQVQLLTSRLATLRT